jgi:serine/threonine protein kinase
MSSRRFGDFELQKRIGRDGPFMIFSARQISLNRPVMLKILPERTATLERAALLRREAQAADKLDHPGVVRLYESGGAGGSSFLALAPVDGEQLSERLKKGAMPPRQALDLIRQLGEAIGHAHDRGVIHGSLRPEVVWITHDGQARLSGFGCPIQFEELDAEAVVGCAGYLAPEQAGMRGAVGRATDVYGLGALLYAMATGGPPHRAATVDETMRLIRRRRAVRPSRLRPGLPEELDSICLKCLRITPAHRYGPDRPVAKLTADARRALVGPVESFLNEPIGRWLRRNGRLVRAAALLLAFAVIPLAWDRQHRASDWDALSRTDTGAERYELALQHFERLAADQPFDAETEAGLALARFRLGRHSGEPVDPTMWHTVRDEWTAVRMLTRILAAAKQDRREEARTALRFWQNAGYRPDSDVERRLLNECERNLATKPASTTDDA